MPLENVYVQTRTLVDPAPIDATVNLINDATSPLVCDGSAFASTSSGTEPFAYYWFDCSGNPCGINTQNISALCPGEYYVTVNDANGCSSISSCIAVGNVSGIQEKNTDLSYSLFPNPTSEMINITITGIIENSFIELMDLSGRTILRMEAENNNSINLLNFDIESGSYFVRIENKGASHVEKIMFVR